MWKSIPSLDGNYEVTACGQVRSVPRTMIRSNGRPHTIPGKKLTPHPDTKGYPGVHCYKNKKRVRYSVHRLVYEAHVGLIPNDMVVDHIDGSKDNFHISNLQLLKRSENILKQFEDSYMRGYNQAIKDLSNENYKIC